MSFVLVTGPTVEPLSAADVRARLNIGAETVDATLNALVSAARLNIERRFGVAMITQTLDYVQDGFPGCPTGLGYNSAERGFFPPQSFGSDSLSHQRVGQSDVVLPMSPVQSVASVSYSDSDGSLQTLDPSTYVLTKGDLQSRLSQAVNSSWPATQYASGSVKVRVIAGFGDTADKVPETLKLAVLLRVSYMVSLTAGNLFVSSETEDGIGSTSYVVGGNAGAAIDAAVSSLLQDYVRPSL